MIRRDFLKASWIAAGSTLIPSRPWASQTAIKIGIVGTGWWATDVLIPAALDSDRFEIVGLCDVESNALTRASRKILESGAQQPRLFEDYREMFDLPGLEAVVIATPTHWHALQFIDACHKGLHVYLEKPVSYDVHEGQAMLKAKRQANTIVQVSFPRVVFGVNDEVREYLNSGEAGEIYEVKANIHWREGAVAEFDPPSTLNHDKFVGPAQEVPFVSGSEGGSWNWRSQYNFSKGIMPDWGIHYIHNLRQVLNLDLPNQVSATGGILKNHTHDNPDYLDVKFDFNGLPVYWSHRTWGFNNPMPETNHGVFYCGDKATVFASDQGWKVYSSDASKRMTKGEIRFLWGENETYTNAFAKAFAELFYNFAEGIRYKTNEHIINTLEDSEKTTACINYGDIAYRSQAPISIDTTSGRMAGNDKAMAMLARQYRHPYRHPFA